MLTDLRMKLALALNDAAITPKQKLKIKDELEYDIQKLEDE